MQNLGSEFDRAECLTAPAFVQALKVALQDQFPASDNNDSMEISEIAGTGSLFKHFAEFRRETSFGWRDRLPVMGRPCMR